MGFSGGGGLGTAATQALIDSSVGSLSNYRDTSVGFRNRIINGAMAIDQRNGGASQTITAAAALAYCLDRWYAACTGANITVQQITDANAQLRMKFTGAASNTGVTLGQRIERLNSCDMAGLTCTLSLKASSNSLTTLSWAAYYANTNDTFGSLASPTRTSIASGSFTISGTEGTYSAQIAVPSAATTGIEIVLTGGALVAAKTLTIGDVQLEAGSAATPFERRSITQEQQLCYRYYRSMTNPPLRGVATSTSLVSRFGMPLTVPMRIAPTPTLSSTLPVFDGITAVTLSSINGDFCKYDKIEMDCNVTGGSLTTGAACIVYESGTGRLLLSAEM